MGFSSGPTGADLLGTVLERYPDDVDTALGEWEKTLRPSIADFQQSAFDQRAIVVMDDERQIGMRRLVTRMRSLPLVRPVLNKVTPMKLGGLKGADIVGTALATLSLDPPNTPQTGPPSFPPLPERSRLRCALRARLHLSSSTFRR